MTSNGTVWISAAPAVTLTGAQTFTNKTLTSPKINEDVALVSTSTDLNTIHGATLVETVDYSLVKNTQISAALTDGTPTDTEIDTATGTTPSVAGSGYHRVIKDSNGTGLLYYIESDGTSWFYLVMTKAN